MTATDDVARAGRAAETAVVAVRMDDRAAIVVRGKDRTTWLNGLVTCDLAKRAKGAAMYGLIVEKKGRIQTDFFVVPSRDDEELALVVPRGLRDSIVQTLDHYLVMEDAELDARDLCFWHLNGPSAARLIEARGPAYAGTLDLLLLGGAIVGSLAADADAFGAELARSVNDLGGVVADERSWDALRIERGVPRFGVEVDGSLYPQEASLEKLAVSFDKGCYLGQEVVYMLENRGHVKRKLVPLEIEGDAPLGSGEPVTTAEGATVGDVKSSVIGPSGRPVAIAMVKYAQAKVGTSLRVGARAVRVAEVRASDRA
jgi:folate-binding protein YgfZ